MFVLCGGLGKRLRSITEKIPKPMLKFSGKPFLEYLLIYCKMQGIKNFVLSVGYLKEKIIKYFGNGRKWGIDIKYSNENCPLGTGGALRKARKLLGKDFFVVNGDTFVEIDLAAMKKFYKSKKAICTIGVLEQRREQNSGFIKFDNAGRITAFKSKKSGNAYINSGVYLMNKNIFKYIPKGISSLENDVFAKMNTGLYAFRLQSSYFIDIGTIKTYNQSVKEFYKVKNVISNSLKSAS